MILILAALMYFIPSFVAGCTHHRSFAGIFLLNIFFGWTAVGWLVALVWAFNNPQKPQTIIIQNIVSSAPVNLGYQAQPQQPQQQPRYIPELNAPTPVVPLYTAPAKEFTFSALEENQPQNRSEIRNHNW
jgi:hypothetical protein